jgi:hypothetical protein
MMFKVSMSRNGQDLPQKSRFPDFHHGLHEPGWFKKGCLHISVSLAVPCRLNSCLAWLMNIAGADRAIEREKN